jgi:hypothetical protein
MLHSCKVSHKVLNCIPFQYHLPFVKKDVGVGEDVGGGGSI